VERDREAFCAKHPHVQLQTVALAER